MNQLKKFYFNFCKDLRVSIIVLVVLSFIAALLELIGFAPLVKIFEFITNKSHFCTNEFTQKIIDLFNLDTDKKFFLCFMGIAFLIFSLKDLFMFFHQYYTNYFLTKLRINIGNLFMTKLLQSPYIFFLKKNSDDLVNTIDNTLRYVIMLYMSYVIQFFVYGFLLIVLLVYALYKFLLPTTFSLMVMGGLVYLQVKFFKKTIHFVSTQTTEANNKNIYILQKIMHAIKEIKMLNAEKSIFKSFEGSSKVVCDTEQKGAYINNVQVFFTEVVIFAGLFVFLFNIVCLYSFEDAIVNLALMVAIFFRAAPALNRVVCAYGSMKSYQGSLESLNREYETILFESKKIVASIKNPISFSKGLFLKNINFKYDSNKSYALKDISINIEKGKFIGVIGGSGAGKSTLVNILLGLLQPTFGTYYIDDKIINNENASAIKNLFGYVPQSPFIDSTTISNNIGFCDDALDINRVRTLMDQCCLDKFPINYPIKENGKTLSGGQCQRIALARALYKKPQILILDEATSALDIQTEEKIMKFINSLKKEITIISISHRLTSLKYCDKIVFLKEGKIVNFDTLKNLKMFNKDFVEMVNLSQI